MPVLGVNINDNMNIDEDDDDEKPLAAVKEKISHSQTLGTPSPSKAASSLASATKTPRAVVARPPTSHGSKKKPSASKSVKKQPALVYLNDSSSSDDEVLSKFVGSGSNSESPNTSKNGTKSPPRTPKTPKSAKSSTVKSPVKKSPTSASRTNSSFFFSPTSRKQRRFNTMSGRLEKLWAAKRNDPQSKKAKQTYNEYAKVVVKSLEKSEIDRIPDPAIRADVTKRYEAIIEKKKMERMSEREKAEYLKEKHKQQQAVKRTVHQQKLQDEKNRYEDTAVPCEPLPAAKPVVLPDGLSDFEYGDVLMVVNFIRSYSGLLSPKEDVRMLPDDFANALADSTNGYTYVAKVVLILLHALIHDEESAFRKEIGVKLTDLELNSSTVGELIRLCLRKQDDEMDDDMDDQRSKSSHFSTVSDFVIDAKMLDTISEVNFYDLPASSKLKLIVALLERLLASVAVENYFLDVQQQWADALTERNAAAQEVNKLDKEAKAAGESKPGTPQPANAEDVEDIASKVKKRRLMLEEKAKREAEERQMKEKELAEQKIRSRLDIANKKLEEITALKKTLLRVEPLGTDRDHNRYWYFGKWLPFVFVEKGWSLVNQPQEDIFEKLDGTPEPFMETTFPKDEPNTWLVYDTVEVVEDLIRALCKRGIRESKLKEQLEKCCSEMKAVKESGKSTTTASSMTIKDYVPPLDDFQAKLLQLETSVRTSGLGGVDNFEDWKASLESSTTLPEMMDKLLHMAKFLRPTLLCGILEPEDQSGAEKRDSTADTKIVSRGMLRWMDEVRQCKTWSRLHVLMSMLKSCIRWDRSLDYIKCQICRKKQGDDFALVCDGCNAVYHTYCLRPPLKKIPQGEWYCVSCKPRFATSLPRAAKKLKPGAYLEKREESDADDENEEMESEESDQSTENAAREDGHCVMCGEGEFEDQSDELITCSQCSAAFHLNCHNPPLRHKPRGAWRCRHCLSGRTLRSTRLRDRVENERKTRSSAGPNQAAVSLKNRDLFDDEASSDSASTSGGKRKRLL